MQVGEAKKMGVEVKLVEAGDGLNYPKTGDRLTMKYTGSLTNGKVFDSTEDESGTTKGKPFKFNIGEGQVIEGWERGIPLMSLGEKASLFISSDFGYGERGYDDAIPPNSDLVFEVELLAINSMKAVQDKLTEEEQQAVADSFLPSGLTDISRKPKPIYSEDSSKKKKKKKRKGKN